MKKEELNKFIAQAIKDAANGDDKAFRNGIEALSKASDGNRKLFDCVFFAVGTASDGDESRSYDSLDKFVEKCPQFADEYHEARATIESLGIASGGWSELQTKASDARNSALREGKTSREAVEIGVKAICGDQEIIDEAMAKYDEIVGPAKVSEEVIAESEEVPEAAPEQKPEDEPKAEKTPEPAKPKRKFWHSFWIIVGILIPIVVIVMALQPLHEKSEKPESPTVVSQTTLDSVDKILQDAGWLEKQYVLDQEVDPDDDGSAAGKGNFGGEIRTNNQAVKFLGSGSTGANLLMDRIKAETGATEGAILNPSNWVSVQPLVDFKYPGNTYLKDGKVVNAGVRDGKAGDIFMMFVDPLSKKFITVRGACANPQTSTPVIVVIPPEGGDDDQGLTPKSTDPDDYKKPGDDNETDSGKGTKPIVPYVTKSADTSAPDVDTSEKLNKNVQITDKSTKDPGSETGITAGGTTTSAGVEREDTPKPEKGVNPKKNNDGTNTDTVIYPSTFDTQN